MPSFAAAVFLAAAVPVLVAALVWGAVTAMRILLPERPLPFVPDPRAARRAARARGESVRVGFREIYEDLPEHARALPMPQRHAVGEGLEEAPEAWREDLWRRRN